MATQNPNIPNPPATFDDLPPELVMMILREIDDPLTLGSMLNASPRAMRVFHLSPTDITGPVLYPGEGSAIHDMICIVAAIRMGKITSPSLNHFYNQYISRIGQTGGSRTLEHILDTMNRNDSNRCRWIPETVYKVRWHTKRCLKYYMDRFMTLRTERPRDPNFQYANHPLPPWRRRVVSYWPATYSTGRPTAQEEFLVLRAFWRLQIEYELQNAYIAGILHWPQDEASLFPFDRSQIWAESDDDEFKAIMATVSEYVRANKDQDYPIIADNDTQTLRRLPRTQKSWSFTYRAPDDLPESLECDDESIRAHPQPGVQFWDMLCWDPFSPLQGIPFDHFVQFGFAIWDLQRFCARYLLSPDESIWTQTNTNARARLYFTWRRLLTAQQRRDIDARSDAVV
ncbi:hypothetical protein PHISCL_03601 [Aspergillus sclerotialis]|uniref:F-box domain-containing protein n=1 Tax=Aspergillus sclerotialis TaxID=2070753 RepID=A0A3A3A1P4_9EURO|nr:hypothetical protein PHISCL_03601 [Aspergillus sclerotialis]